MYLYELASGSMQSTSLTKQRGPTPALKKNLQRSRTLNGLEYLHWKLLELSGTTNLSNHPLHLYKSLHTKPLSFPSESKIEKSKTQNQIILILSAFCFLTEEIMDSPFYRSYWDLPSCPPAPARHALSVREIPVQYVGSEKQEVRIPSEKRSESRSESALKIQRLLRGFLVRKSVKRIVELRAEVGKIEKTISKTETVELLGRDSKERLRVNETLMSLLFKLDSVRGVDSGVRDCRKAVIKRIIALQEILDAVVVSNNDNSNVDQTVVDDVVDQTVKVDCTENDENRDGEEIVNDQSDNADKEVVDKNDAMPSPVSDCPKGSVGTSQTDSRSDSSSANPESLVEACEEDDASSLKQEKNDGDGIGTDQIEDKGENVKESKEGNVSNRELLLERMMEDNEKMMDLMAQLFERNEMQTRLLSSLSQRVEQLERAFLFERLRKKRSQAAACTVDGCDMSPGVKKCGKR